MTKEVMEARELRIGNYVLCRGAVARVTSISEDGIGYVKQSGISEGKIPFKLVKPIPMTEEWLVKFGFVIFNEYFFKEFGNHNEFSITLFDYDNGKFIYNPKTHFNYIDIIHAHQLQNLYFALTNEELTIKND
jgi:hypothetical protein